MNALSITQALVGSLSLPGDQPIDPPSVRYTVALIAAIASIVVAIISAFVSGLSLIISRMSQSALQREQAQLVQNNQKELEDVKAQLFLQTQNQLENAKAVLNETTQRRLEELKEELQRRAKIVGHVAENRFKASEVLMTGFKNALVQVYAYQRLAEDRDWAANNRESEIKRIAGLLSSAEAKFDAYTLYFDGCALEEIMTIYAELMSVICNDIDNHQRLDRINSRMSMLFTLLRDQLGIAPLSLDSELIQKHGKKELTEGEEVSEG